MDFALLGPLVVRRDGTAVVIPTGKQRVVLAALLLAPDQVLTFDDLIEKVWDGRPPGSARVTLQGHVKRLRRILGDHTGSPIVTRPAGYTITTAGHELDASRFDALLAEGQQHAWQDRWQSVADTMRTALRLWRGQPLLDVPSQTLARAMVPRLTEMRLRALGWRVAADLRLGRHEQLVGELSELTDEFPLRERLHGQLMTALYRSGRQADALAVYHRLRRLLADELGVDPDPESQLLYQRVLAADSALLAPVPRPVVPVAGSPTMVVVSTTPDGQAQRRSRPPSVVRPAQLPADLVDFTGRAGQAKRLADLLTAQPRDNPHALVIAAVTGAGGIGKTALAVHVAQQVAEYFPDGQLYVDLRGTGPAARVPGDVLHDFLRDLAPVLDPLPLDEAALAARYRSLLAGRRVLVVLDNAQDAAQVRALLPGASGCAVMITSRGRLAGLAGATTIHLDVLDDDEARALFTAIVGVERCDAEPRATAAVLACCAGLPLAVRVAAARLGSRPAWDVATLAARLADERNRLDELQAEDVAVRASLEVSYRDLGHAGQARVFRLLGLFGGSDIGLPAVAALVGLPAGDTAQALEPLVDVNLVQAPAPDRYRLHDLVRVLASELATAEEPPEQRRAAAVRLARWCLGALADVDLIIAPHRRRPPFARQDTDPPGPVVDSTESALAWCEAERETILAATRLVAAHDLHELTWHLPAYAQSYYSLRALWSDWLTTNELGLRSVRLLGDRAAEAYLLTGRGEALGRTHQLTAAQRCFATSLEIRREIGDVAGELSTLIGLGVLAEQQGDYRRAIGHTTDALAVARSIHDRSAESYALANIGVYEDHLGNTDAAIARHRQSLVLFRELGNVSGEGLALLNIAEAHLHADRHDTALGQLREALPVIRDGGDRYDEAMATTHIGRILADLGRTAEARDHLLTALAMWGTVDEAEAERVRELLSTVGHRS